MAGAENRPHMPPDLSGAEIPTCQSCGARGSGAYCSACGERFLTADDLSFSHFLVHDLAHELFHWDGKIGRTLRSLVTKPGDYAARFVKGQRTPYLNPLRLYLVVFILQAFIGAIGTPQLTLTERAERYDPTGFTSHLASERGLATRQSPHSETAATDAHWIAELGTLLIAFLVSAVQMLLLRRFHRRYIEHLTLCLTVVTFSMLVMIAGCVITLAMGLGQVTQGADAVRQNAAAIVLPVYWFFAVKRFYSTTAGASLLYAAGITLANFAIALAINLAIIAILVEAA